MCNVATSMDDFEITPQRSPDKHSPLVTEASSDYALIVLICQHHEPALALLYDRYGARVYALAMRMVGDRSLAEEVTQDVFHAVWRSARGFQLDGNVLAWLIGITRHRAGDIIRGRHFQTHQAAVPFNELFAPARIMTSDTAVEALLEREHMQQVLAELPALQRQIIELAYYGGFTCAEIAVSRGIPLGTVKTRLRTGLLRLRALLLAGSAGVEKEMP